MAVVAISVVVGAMTVPVPVALAASTGLSFQTQSSSLSATKVVDELGFTPSGPLAGGASSIWVTAPAGVVLSVYTTVYLHDETTDQTALLWPPVTTDAATGTDTVTITVPDTWSTGGSPGIDAGDQVYVDLINVQNPTSASSGDWVVRTSADPDPIVVATQSFTELTSVTGPALYLSSTFSGATDVQYTAAFTLTTELRNSDYRSWDLFAADGPHGGASQISFTAPDGASFPNACPAANLIDFTAGIYQTLTCAEVTGNTVDYVVSGAVPAGNTVGLRIEGMTNPVDIGPAEVSVSTTADPGAAVFSVDIDPPGQVSGVTFESQSDSRSATQVVDEIGFIPQSHLPGGSSASIVITAPPGVRLSDEPNTAIVTDITYDQTTWGTVSVSTVADTDTLTVGLGNFAIAGGNQVYVDLAGVTNPATAGSGDWSVSTSNDAEPVVAGTQTFTGPSTVTGLDLKAMSTSLGATDVTYEAEFTVPHGLRTVDYRGNALSSGPSGPAGGNSLITFTAPTGGSFPNGCGSAMLTDEATPTADQTLGCVSSSGHTAVYYVTADVPAGDTVSVTIPDVTNPSSTNSLNASVSTSADPGVRRTLVYDAVPVINGTLEAHSPLTVTRSSFVGRLRFTEQWQQCDGTGANCADIPGAARAAYTPSNGDIGHQVRVVETARDRAGITGTATSWPVGPITTPPAPVSTSAPVISGTARIGSTLQGITGGWVSLEKPLTYGYRWQRCDAAGLGCVDITAATTLTYRPVVDDLGHTLVLMQTASDQLAQVATASSAPTAEVDQPAVPVNDVLPAIQGVMAVGQRLTATSGHWISAATPLMYARQWQRCDPEGANCSDIAGATGAQYTPTYPDIGATFKVVVTAIDQFGHSGVAAAPATAPLPEPGAPVNQRLPEIAGTAEMGSLVRTTTGRWSADGEFSYQWQRCDAAGGNCVDIPTSPTALTQPTYRLAAPDIGHTVRVAVVVVANYNGLHSLPAYSVAVGPVPVPVDPANTEPPSIAGSTVVPTTLTASRGTWTSRAGPLTYSYRWVACDQVTPSECSVVPNATRAALLATSASHLAGFRVFVEVTATDGLGHSTTAASPPTAQLVEALPPVTLTGTPEYRQLVRPARWPVSRQASFEWLRCNADGSNCVPIPDASGVALEELRGLAYRVAYADVGHSIALALHLEAGDIAGGGGDVTSAAVGPVPVPPGPANSTPPTISGPTVTGFQLAAQRGTWTSSVPPLGYTYQWQRCEEAPHTGCVDISGATLAKYWLTGADAGYRMTVVVTATDAAGATVSVPASLTHVVVVPAANGAPTNWDYPSVVGTPQQGETLTADPGQWVTSPSGHAISYEYHWQRCDGAGENCADLPGAQGTSYTPGSSDVGYYLSLRVTATDTSTLISADETAPPVGPVVLAAPDD